MPDNPYTPRDMGDRLASVRKKLELNREDFGSQLSVSKNTIAHYERGERRPDAQFLALLRQTFGTDLNWLMTGEDVRSSQTHNLMELSPTVPIVGLADCGLGNWSEETAVGGRVSVPDNILDADAFAVLTTGTSMMPSGIPPGVLCFCSPNTKVAPGDAVFVERYNNTASIKIFEKRDDKWYYFLGYMEPDAEGTQKIFTERLTPRGIKRIAPVIWEKRRL